MKLCIIYNYAQHYRANIFKLIDKTFECEWFFGDYMGDVKKMDYSLLSNPVQEMKTISFGSFSYQKGVPSLLFKHFTHYLILPDTRSVSSWLFLFLSRLFYKKKVYIWTHGWYGKESLIEVLLKKIMYRLPSGGIFVYGSYAKELMIKEGFNHEKIHVIHNSLAYDEQLLIRKSLSLSNIYKNHFNNENPNLFFVGRLTPVKKLNQVLDALDLCNKKNIYFNFTFIGGGSELEKLKSRSSELGLDKQVWFFGPCYDEWELSSLIYNADLCVAPGNIGLTAMHSLVFGTPCLTHNDYPYQMPEFESIKEGITGAFFKRDDVYSLAEQIIKWFKAHKGDRDNVRSVCMKEIDDYWNPYFQINILKEYISD